MAGRGQMGLLIISFCTDIFVGSSWCGVRRDWFDICNTWFMDSLINLTDLGGSRFLTTRFEGKFRHPTETTRLAVKNTSLNKLKRIYLSVFLVSLVGGPFFVILF